MVTRFRCMAARTCSMMMLSAVAAVLSPASTLAVNVQAGAHPLNGVILVDESESESPGDVTHEGQAASAIARSALNHGSRGSLYRPHHGRVLADSYRGTSNLIFLARCVSDLHPWTAASTSRTTPATPSLTGSRLCSAE